MLVKNVFLWAQHFTISSSQIGQMSLELAVVSEGPPFSRDTLELISCAWSGRGEETSNESEFSEGKETGLSDGESRLECVGRAGGAKDLPLPNILPPPSRRKDIAGINASAVYEAYTVMFSLSFA